MIQTASILTDLEFNETKPAIKVLLESNYSKEIRIAFNKGQLMKAHKTSFPITVEIFEGTLNFGVSGKVYHLKKGDIISLPANEVHDLEATDKSIVRLTLSKNDSIDRVQKVID